MTTGVDGIVLISLLANSTRSMPSGAASPDSDALGRRLTVCDCDLDVHAAEGAVAFYPASVESGPCRLQRHMRRDALGTGPNLFAAAEVAVA